MTLPAATAAASSMGAILFAAIVGALAFYYYLVQRKRKEDGKKTQDAVSGLSEKVDDAFSFSNPLVNKTQDAVSAPSDKVDDAFSYSNPLANIVGDKEKGQRGEAKGATTIGPLSGVALSSVGPTTPAEAVSLNLASAVVMATRTPPFSAQPDATAAATATVRKNRFDGGSRSPIRRRSALVVSRSPRAPALTGEAPPSLNLPPPSATYVASENPLFRRVNRAPMVGEKIADSPYAAHSYVPPIAAVQSAISKNPFVREALRQSDSQAMSDRAFAAALPGATTLLPTIVTTARPVAPRLDIPRPALPRFLEGMTARPALEKPPSLRSMSASTPSLASRASADAPLAVTPHEPAPIATDAETHHQGGVVGSSSTAASEAVPTKAAAKPPGATEATAPMNRATSAPQSMASPPVAAGAQAAIAIPEGFTLRFSRTAGRNYLFNPMTGEAMAVNENTGASGAGEQSRASWVARVSRTTGVRYWYNNVSGQSQLEEPK
jgi:hypothetical protein